MAFTFSCPDCRAVLHLPDEAAGQSGQCPRCQVVMRIPSSTQPRAVVIDPSTGVPKELPPAPPPPKPMPSYDRAQPPRRQPRPVKPKPPAGPVWPTAVGIFGGLICVGLLFASVVTLFSVRATESVKPKAPQAMEDVRKAPQVMEDVRQGQLQGNRVVEFHHGVLEVRTSLNGHDALDPDQINCRCKSYEIEMIANRTYIIEQDSPNFDCVLRVETDDNQVLDRAGGLGQRHARIEFTPRNTALHVIYVTSDQPAFGPLTLFIRELPGPRKGF